MASPKQSKKPEKSQGSILGGIIFLFAGVIGLVVGIWCFSPGGSVDVVLDTIWLFLLALLCIIAGIYALYRGIVNQKVAEKGTKSTCVVEKFTTIGGRGPATIWMDVKFKTQSGKEAIYSARVNDEAITTLKKGMVLECLVLGEECYIDPNNIKIVDESSLTADDTIEF